MFSLKILENYFGGYSYSFRKDLSREYLVVSKFLLEVPKFKENIPICIITVTKERDFLRTLLQVMKQYLRHSFQNESI